jgi:hypothetical protein
MTSPRVSPKAVAPFVADEPRFRNDFSRIVPERVTVQLMKGVLNLLEGWTVAEDHSPAVLTLIVGSGKKARGISANVTQREGSTLVRTLSKAPMRTSTRHIFSYLELNMGLGGGGRRRSAPKGTRK